MAKRIIKTYDHEFKSQAVKLAQEINYCRIYNAYLHWAFKTSRHESKASNNLHV